MNSSQGAWGIQDPHDRVISILSGVVVCLLVVYALIFASKQLAPASPQAAAAPTPSASPAIPVPPTRAPPATRPVVRPGTPAPTRRAPPVHTRVARLPSPVARPVTRLPTPTPVAPTPRTVAIPTPAPATRVVPPTPAAPPTPAPAETPVVLRVGDAFPTGAEALSFALNRDLTGFRLTRATNRPDSPLYLEIGPFPTRAQGLARLEEVRRQVGDSGVPVVMRPVEGSAPAARPIREITPPTSRPSPPATRTPPPAPTRTPVPTRVAPPPTRVAQPPTPAIPLDRLPVDPPTAPPTATGPALSQGDLARLHGIPAPPTDGYSVQVASFSSAGNAVNFRKHLVAQGYDAHVASVDVQGQSYYRVLLGQFPDLGAARVLADRFSADHPDLYQVFVRKL